MAQQYQQRPSSLVGLSDSYAAFCLDEAVYVFGIYVESELHSATKETTDSKKAEAQRRNVLARIFAMDDYDEQQASSVPQGVHQSDDFVHDADDPVSIETARRMPPAVKFTGRKFADPAKLFKKKEE